MKNMQRIASPLTFIVLFSLSMTSFAEKWSLETEHIVVKFNEQIRIESIARTDGTDRLEIESDVFEILLMDDQRFTVDDYELHFDGNENTPRESSVSLRYHRKASTSSAAPEVVDVSYQIDGPYLYKDIYVPLFEGDMIDRLSTLRMSTDQKASRGGRGQPIFVGNWFFGVNYPCFYSRHTDDYIEPDFYYRWDYMIDLEGRDEVVAPCEHLLTCFHFPGQAVRQSDGSWGIRSKRSVIGLSRRKGETAELALLDYITETRKPTRSYFHYNNWYSTDAKTVTVDGFVENTYMPMAQQLARAGVALDAMVPDHGWEDGKAYDAIFQPKIDATHEPLPRIREALEAAGTKLGIWIALDGTNVSIDRGLEIGYREAYRPNFEKPFRWQEGKRYFDILQPKYNADLREALRFLIEEAGVDYIKHDFNHCFTTHELTQRHAREKCLDEFLDLLAYERSMHPGIFQNYTNGSWFSPFWLQHVDCLWMMSGDSGGSGDWPQISLREGATTYRDRYFYQSFNNPERCVRPIIPIANFMTHGILYTEKKPFTDFNDTLLDWSNYVMMYFARGTTLKELYVDYELLDDDHWLILGQAAAWAIENQGRLMNTVQIGGDAAQGQVYGYVSWVDDRAILTVRNPHRAMQRLDVPMDARVYHRATPGESYHARAIYPYVEEMSWKMTSGENFKIDVPGDSVVVYELEPGTSAVKSMIVSAPLPPVETHLDEDRFSLTLEIPDEEFERFDLMIEPWALARSELTINGEKADPNRYQTGKRWTLSAYDLRPYRGKTIRVAGYLKVVDPTGIRADRKVAMDAWLVVDRKAPLSTPVADHERRLPPTRFSDSRRLTVKAIPMTTFRAIE